MVNLIGLKATNIVVYPSISIMELPLFSTQSNVLMLVLATNFIIWTFQSYINSISSIKTPYIPMGTQFKKSIKPKLTLTPQDPLVYAYPLGESN